MTESLYIASLGPNSGKFVISLGVMEMLSREVDWLGFFRPIASGSVEIDSHIQLFASRFNLSLLASEITTKTRRDPEEHDKALTEKFGAPVFARIDALASMEQKAILKNLVAERC